MPNIHKADREPLSFQIPRHLMLRLKKCAKKRGQSLTQFATEALYSTVENVSLTADDYRRIAEATELAQSTGRRHATDFSQHHEQ